MAVGEDVGFNANQIAHGAFRGEAAAVHFGGDCFNDDALASVGLSHCHVDVTFFVLVAIVRVEHALCAK